MNSILTVALNGCRLGHTSNVGHTDAVKRLQRLAFDFDRKRERATKKWSSLSRQFALSGGSAAGIATRIFTGLHAHANIVNLERSKKQGDKTLVTIITHALQLQGG